MMAGLSWVINFANSVVGVGVLAMPYCFYECGILLSAAMVLVTAGLTKYTCEFLLRSSSYTRKTTFEQIAFHVYGNLGKLITEISIMGLLIGTLVAFQVVIGDLAPAIVHHALGLQQSWMLRAIIMFGSSGLILPISMMRNVASLGNLNAISMGFYMFFIAVIVCFSLPNLYQMDWLSKVNFWRPAAFFKCFPIISMAFTCQTQVLVMYSALPDPNMKTMQEIINKAINLVAGVYITVGTFGYISFFKAGVDGDVLENFPHGFFTDAIKLGFWLSVVLSFPLIVFPVRAAINSLLYANKKQGVLHDVISSSADYIAPDKFTSITVSLVFGTLVIGILIPNIETVLSITGAVVGTFLGFVFPSALFIMAGAKDRKKTIAQTILIVSTIAMVVSTVSVLSNINSAEPRPAHDPHGNQKAVIKTLPKLSELDTKLATLPPTVELLHRDKEILDKPVVKVELVDEGTIRKDHKKSHSPNLLLKDENLKEMEVLDTIRKSLDITKAPQVENSNEKHQLRHQLSSNDAGNTIDKDKNDAMNDNLKKKPKDNLINESSNELRNNTAIKTDAIVIENKVDVGRSNEVNIHEKHETKVDKIIKINDSLPLATELSTGKIKAPKRDILKL